MRKLLMASAAILGASLGVANAATVSAGPAVGAPGTSVGTEPYNYLNNASPPAPTPGQIVVHIDLREVTYIGVGWSSDDSIGGNKVQPVDIQGYARLYAGADGLATNGLQYGVAMEIRTNAGSVPNGAMAAPGVTQALSSTSATLFFRRDYLYVGTPTLGRLKIGGIDGPMSFWDLFTIQAAGEGIEDGDAPGLVPGAAQTAYPFPLQGGEYTTGKLVYTSPSFAGVSFAATYEPNSSSFSAGVCSTNAGGCANQSSSNLGSDLTRRRNTVEVGAHYLGSFGGVGVEAAAVGLFGGHINPGPSNPAAIRNFDNLAIGMGQVAVNFAGFSVLGAVLGGDYNGFLAAKPTGATNSLTVGAGVAYAIGPLYLSANVYQLWQQGTAGVNTQRHTLGSGFGFNYNIAPGLGAFGEYIYGWNKQNGVNILTGEPNPGGINLHSNVQAQAALVGLAFRW